MTAVFSVSALLTLPGLVEEAQSHFELGASFAPRFALGGNHPDDVSGGLEGYVIAGPDAMFLGNGFGNCQLQFARHL